MKENTRDNRADRIEEQTSGNEDQIRPNTMNEVIREVNGDPDMNLNDVRASERSGTHERGSGGSNDSDLTQGSSYSPNDTSGVRSGGISDMDDQTAGGAGLNNDVRRGMGSNLTPKNGVTGSDYDGQTRTS